MTLINLTETPPGGYLYYEPALSWTLPRSIALQGLKQAAEALQQVRLNNPQAQLDTSYEACVAAIGEYTCARLSMTDKLAHWCGGEPVTDQEKAQVAAAKAAAAKARASGGCASCGGGR